MLPSSYPQGVTPIDNNGGFGTANMFNKPNPQQQGNMGGYLGKLIAALKGGQFNNSVDASPDNGMFRGNPKDQEQAQMAQSDGMPQMTPYQGQQMSPQMGQVNNPNTMSPNGQPMPNWNRNYGGY